MAKYSQAERAQLADAFNCELNQVDGRLAQFVAASEEEYVRMILGQHVYSRGQDIKVYRLSLMIKHAFGGRLPSEGQISALFQTTATESRGLLRAVRAKFQYELRQAIRSSMQAAVSRANRDEENGEWAMVCDSENIIDALNDAVARHDGSLPRIRKAPGSAGEYTLAPSTYMALTSEILK
ncbi:hypothetical protein ACAG24_024145 [Mycobacterium sp. pW049]|uniref:hypothetical protein n=1 Tax=[Mycobacterium] bulgaricum TaxID=3238985 RepID=UPI00351AECE3